MCPDRGSARPPVGVQDNTPTELHGLRSDFPFLQMRKVGSKRLSASSEASWQARGTAERRTPACRCLSISWVLSSSGRWGLSSAFGEADRASFSKKGQKARKGASEAGECQLSSAQPLAPRAGLLCSVATPAIHSHQHPKISIYLVYLFTDKNAHG